MTEPTDAPQNPTTAARVRRARPDDADALARLRFTFRAERRVAVEPMDEFIARCRQWMLPRLVDESRWSAWLAERDGQPIGNVWVQIVEKIPNPGPESETHAYISSFFVAPAERNSGSGSALLAAAISHCRALGVDTVFLWPTERSIPLYRRAGFIAPEDLLVLELRGGQPG